MPLERDFASRVTCEERRERERSHWHQHQRVFILHAIVNSTAMIKEGDSLNRSTDIIDALVCFRIILTFCRYALPSAKPQHMRLLYCSLLWGTGIRGRSCETLQLTAPLLSKQPLYPYSPSPQLTTLTALQPLPSASKTVLQPLPYISSNTHRFNGSCLGHYLASLKLSHS